MFTKIKKAICYATIPIILSLYSHAIGATQTIVITEQKTEFATVSLTHERMSEQVSRKEIPQIQLNEVAICKGISDFLGDYSYCNKPASKPSTWKQALGAFVELPAQFLGTLLYTPVSGIAQASEAVVNVLEAEVGEISEKGVISYAKNAGIRTVQTIYKDPISAVMIPGSFALTYGNFGQLSRMLLLMGIESADGMNKAKMLHNIAESMKNDDRWIKAAKWALYGGAAYFFITSLPGAQAAQFAFGPEFFISGNTNVLPTLISSGNLLVATWGNTTHIQQSFYNTDTGALVAGPFIINQNPTAVGFSPNALFLDANNVFTTWTSAAFKVVGRKSIISGPLGSEVVLPAGSTGTYGSPTSFLLSTPNRLFLGWSHNTGIHTQVEYGIFDATTFANLFGDKILASSATSDRTFPFCVPYSGGKAVCTFAGNQGGNYAPFSAIVSGSDGSIISGETSVIASLPGTDIIPVPINLGGNPFVFCNKGPNISGIALTSTGVPSGTEMKFNVNSQAASQLLGVTTTSTDGTGIVVWAGSIGGGNRKIYGSTVTPTLRIPEKEFQISTGTTSQSNPAVTSLSNGGIVSAFEGDISGTPGLVGTFANNTGVPGSAYSNAPGILGLVTLVVSLYLAV